MGPRPKRRFPRHLLSRATALSDSYRLNQSRGCLRPPGRLEVLRREESGAEEGPSGAPQSDPGGSSQQERERTRELGRVEKSAPRGSRSEACARVLGRPVRTRASPALSHPLGGFPAQGCGRLDGRLLRLFRPANSRKTTRGAMLTVAA